MKTWKHKLLVAAIPIAAVTAGCIAAQDGLDEIIEDEASFRGWAGYEPRALQLRVIETGIEVIDDFQTCDVDFKEGANEAGSRYLDDLILSTVIDENIGVVFAANAAGDADVCNIEIAEGGSALVEHGFALRGYDSSQRGELLEFDQHESAEACGAAAGFFVEDDVISLCPSSCDAIAGSAAEGSAIMLEVVIASS